MTRYGVAFATELKRSPKEPYELLRFAWQAAIESYKGVDPPLHEFHLTSGIIETACKVYALLPLDEAMLNGATMTAVISYPAYGETTDGQRAWSVLRNALDAMVLNPGPFNDQFKERNPEAFETTFHGMAFTPTEAQRMIELLCRWAETNRVRIAVTP